MPAAVMDASAYEGAAETDVAQDASTMLADFLASARADIRRDPSVADRWLDELERLLVQTGRTPAGLQTTETKTGGLAPWQAARIQRHIEIRLSERLNTAGLAALVGLSENHFARAFKASLGIPPHAYVVQRRLLHAKRLILETDLPLSQVALESGMADQAHLSRRFRRCFGSTPSACRRRHGVVAVAVASEG